MFNIGIGELLFIALLALIFIGPERLPQVMRQLGELVYQVRVITAELTNQFSDELRPIRELQNLANDVNPIKQLGEMLELDSDLNPLKDATPNKPVSNTIAPPQPRPESVSNPMAQIAAAMQAPAAKATAPDRDAAASESTDSTTDTISDPEHSD